MKLICLIQILVILTISDNFTLIRHNSAAARCLDGSSAALYIHPATNSNKFVIYFEGGGLCRGDGLAEMIQYCYQRSFTNLGSSINYPDSRSFDTLSYLSSSPRNPFYDWNRVFIPYCDGSVHQGSKLEPVKYKKGQLYFRGANNTLAHFQYLDNNFKLFSASQIVITGTSAGGLASFIWSNFVYQKANNKQGVLIVPDSGTFIIDFPNIYNNKTLRDYTAQTFNLANAETPMPLSECVEAYPSQTQCFQSGNMYQFIKPKLFVLQSQYDSWGLIQILQFRCIPNTNPSNFDNCNDTEKAYIQKYRAKINQAMNNLTSVQRNGVWSVSCIQHGFLQNMSFMDSEDYRIPTTQGVQINDALTTFMNNGERTYFDNASWPDNIGCNGKKKAKHLKINGKKKAKHLKIN